MYALSAEADLALTRQDALAEGLEMGIDIGREEGREEGIDIGRQQAMQDTILNILLLRFGEIAQTAVPTIQAITDTAVLSDLTTQAAVSQTFAMFERALPEG